MGAVSISECMVERNSAQGFAGGLWFEGGGVKRLTITATRFTANNAEAGRYCPINTRTLTLNFATLNPQTSIHKP